MTQHFLKRDVTTSQHEELYAQSFDEVGVLFASMPNFGGEYNDCFNLRQKSSVRELLLKYKSNGYWQRASHKETQERNSVVVSLVLQLCVTL